MEWLHDIAVEGVVYQAGQKINYFYGSWDNFVFLQSMLSRWGVAEDSQMFLHPKDSGERSPSQHPECETRWWAWSQSKGERSPGSNGGAFKQAFVGVTQSGVVVHLNSHLLTGISLFAYSLVKWGNCPKELRKGAVCFLGRVEGILCNSVSDQSNADKWHSTTPKSRTFLSATW